LRAPLKSVWDKIVNVFCCESRWWKSMTEATAQRDESGKCADVDGSFCVFSNKKCLGLENQMRQAFIKKNKTNKLISLNLNFTVAPDACGNI